MFQLIIITVSLSDVMLAKTLARKKHRFSQGEIKIIWLPQNSDKISVQAIFAYDDVTVTCCSCAAFHVFTYDRVNHNILSRTIKIKIEKLSHSRILFR